MSWEEKHPDNGLAKSWIRRAQTYDGAFSSSKSRYKDNSIDIPKIDPSIPILIIQGTDDKVVPWQATQLLFQEMKEAGDRVQLHLVQGGNHGLTGKYANGRDEYINQWLQQIYQ